MKTINKVITIIFYISLLFIITSCTNTPSSPTNLYIVTFKDYDGTLLKEETVEQNMDATAPNNPTRDGYKFIGWSESFTNIQKNLTVIAQYEKEIKEYTVKFIDHDGTILKEEIVQETKNAYPPSNPSREGYTFIGWDNTYTNILQDTIVVALYKTNEQIQPTCTITFNTNSETKIENQYLEKGDNIKEPTPPTKKGYTFLGWYLDNELWNFIGYVVSKDITLEAKWQINKYTITYDLYNGITSNPNTYTVEDEITLNNPTKVGYTFIGWTADQNDIPTTNLTILNEIGNKHFYANYTLNIYNIILDVNGGDELENNIIEVEYDSYFNLTNYTPTKKGYTFLGWYNNSTNFTQGTWKYDKDIDLTAKWKINNYTVTYDLYNGITSNPNTYTVEDEINLNNPTKEGYTFIGWTTDNNDTPILNLTFSNEIGNKHFYANYTPNIYNIILDVNGGDELENNIIEVEYDSKYDITNIIPTRDKYKFLGWYLIEEKMEFGTYNYLVDMTLKAKWESDKIFKENGIEYLYLGKYPQTLESDSTTITALDNITETNSLGYIEYNGNEYKKVTASPYESNYTFTNGEKIVEGNTYYFKVEPIKWRILETDDGSYKLLSEMVLDNTNFYHTWNETRTINEITIYSNNYEYSNIRAWLNGYDGTSYNVDNYTNKGFIDIAFTDEEKALINETLVDNSLSSTGDSSNSYICNNTIDKIYLLSISEAINYGFSSDPFEYDTTRRATVSDYARGKGCYINTDSLYYGNVWWWLRSPVDSNDYNVRVVGNVGYFYSSYVFSTDSGVRAACTINL